MGPPAPGPPTSQPGRLVIWQIDTSGGRSDLGDLDGDGYDDLLVVEEPSEEEHWTYVTSGPLSGNMDLYGADFALSKGDYLSCGTAPNYNGFISGYDDVTSGDLDGDGDLDVILSSPNWWGTCTATSCHCDTGQYFYGSVFLFAGPVTAARDDVDADVHWLGAGRNDSFGHDMAVIQDIDGDGGDDLAVAQYTSPQQVLVFLDPLSQQGGTGEDEARHHLGDPAGDQRRDQNGDGHGDWRCLHVSGANSFQVYEGSASGLGSGAVATVVLDGAYTFGGGSDFNNDGFDDIAVGYFIMAGPMSGTLNAQNHAHAVLDYDGNHSGYDTSGLYDLDGDGYAEWLSGNRLDATVSPSNGALWMFPGQ